MRLISKAIPFASLFAGVISSTEKQEANRALLGKFLDCHRTGDYDSMINLFTSPSSSYWINGSPARTPIAGDSTVATRIGHFGSFLGAFDDINFAAKSIVADEDRVVLEATVEGEGPGTFLYLQDVIMVFDVKDGKFDSMREYIDHKEMEYLATYFSRVAQAPKCKPGTGKSAEPDREL